MHGTLLKGDNDIPRTIPPSKFRSHKGESDLESNFTVSKSKNVKQSIFAGQSARQ
jgi:hypothetical protein